MDNTGTIRTGLAKTQQSETIALHSAPVDLSGAVQNIAQGGSLYRLDSNNNTINLSDKVSAYLDGGAVPMPA